MKAAKLSGVLILLGICVLLFEGMLFFQHIKNMNELVSTPSESRLRKEAISQDEGEAKGVVAAKGVINVGVLLPLSSRALFVGEQTYDGISLALKDYKNSFALKGYKIAVTAEDSEGNPETAKSVVNKFIDTDKITFIIGPAMSGVAYNIVDITNSNKVILVSPLVAVSALTKDDYFFRINLPEQEVLTQQAEIAVKDLGWGVIACAYPDNESHREMVDLFSQKFIEFGGEDVLNCPFEEGTSDFSSYLMGIKELSPAPEAIFIVSGRALIDIITQMKELDIDMQVYAGPDFENEDIVDTLGNNAEGIIYTSPSEYVPSIDSYEFKSTQDFVSRYKEEYGSEPSLFSALGYDAASLLYRGLLESIPDFSADNVKKNLLNLKYRGVTGMIELDHNGDLTRKLYLRTVRGGKFVKYTEPEEHIAK